MTNTILVRLFSCNHFPLIPGITILLHQISLSFTPIQTKMANSYDEIFINDGYNLATDLTEKASIDAIIDATRQLYEQTDLLTGSFLERCKHSNIPVDCKMGCEWCCHQPVFALTHEMLIVVEYIRQHFSIEALAQVQKVAAEKTAFTQTLPTNALLSINKPCPLLRNGACSVYPVRPMACRIYLSSDVKTCKHKHDCPTDPNVKPALFGFMLDAGRHLNAGFVSGLKVKNLISNEAPLEWLLHKLLGDNEAFARWLEGEILNEAFDFQE